MDALSSAIGRSVPRIDGRPKVTGHSLFAGDIDVRGLLHARPVLALPAHALIERSTPPTRSRCLVSWPS